MRKLQNKVLFLTLGLITVLGLAVILFVHLSFTDVLETELRDKGISLTKNLVELSLDNLLTEHHLRLQMQITEFKESNDDIKYIFIVNNEGNVIIHTFEKGFPSALLNAHAVKENNDFCFTTLKNGEELIMDIGVPIMKGTLGMLRMGISENHIKETIRDTTWSLVGILCVVLIAGLIIAIVFSSAITKPVSELTDAAREFGRGDLDRKVTIKSNDEIGNLEKIFNTMAETLKKSTSQVKQRTQELQEFLFIASHDLQEPLRKVLIYSNRLNSEYGDIIDDKGKMYFEHQHRAVEHLRTILYDLVHFTQLTTRNVSFAAVDLCEVGKEVVSDLDGFISQTGGHVEIDTLPVIEADTAEMHQLLKSLIENSLKFSKKDQAPLVKISGKLISRNEEDPDHSTGKNEFIELSVQDNGIGFDQKYIDRIFRSFQQLHDNYEYKGTGMGLAICKKITDKHGGDITARSSEGDGATFIATLPVKHNGGQNEPA